MSNNQCGKMINELSSWSSDNTFVFGAGALRFKPREKVSCVIFGAPRDLLDNVLPTYTDIMKYDIQIRYQLASSQKKVCYFVGYCREIVPQNKTNVGKRFLAHNKP